jgi:acetyl-CoA carboxylase biotin carboxyl carrier protein
MPDERDPTLPDLRYVRELAKVFKQYGLDEIEIENGEQRILLRRGDLSGGGYVASTGAPAPAPAPAPLAAAPVAAEPEEAVIEGDYITSPFVGTFYRSPRPDAPSFVEVGSRITKGQTVCIVEAMKLFNEIEADFGGEVLEILVDNGQAVEFGAKLYRVRRQ